MPFEIKVVFEAVGFVKQAAELFGVLDTLDVKIDHLAASKLEAGMRAIRQAQNSQCEQRSLLQEARMEFNQAISLERNERLAAAYLCLAFCHHGLGDIDNCIDALRNVLDVSFQDNAGVAKVVAVKVVAGTFFPPVKTIGDAMLDEIQEREDSLAAIKQSVADYLAA